MLRGKIKRKINLENNKKIEIIITGTKIGLKNKCNKIARDKIGKKINKENYIKT
jgi:hypothetical protein